MRARLQLINVPISHPVKEIEFLAEFLTLTKSTYPLTSVSCRCCSTSNVRIIGKPAHSLYSGLRYGLISVKFGTIKGYMSIWVSNYIKVYKVNCD